MIFADNLIAPEGPVMLPDRSWLVVEMDPERGGITHISADGLNRRIITRTGRPNGLAVDEHGTLWVAESRNPPALLRVSMDGQVDYFLMEWDGKPFLWPNDLAIGPDGRLYMTDSGVHYEDFLISNEARSDYQSAKIDGKVFAIDVMRRKVELVDSGLQFTNGIAFGPDGDLYVSEKLTGTVHRYRQENGRIVGERELFGNVIDPEKPSVSAGPDGMAFGANGLLYVAVCGQGDVTVLDPDGTVVQRIDTGGSKPTNVTFGAQGDKRIYVTEIEKGALLALDVDTDGLPPRSHLEY